MNPIKSNGAGPSNAPVKVNFDLSCDISMSNYFKSSFARTMAIDSMKRESRSLDCALFQKQRQGPIHGSKPFKNVHKTNIGTNVWHRAKVRHILIFFRIFLNPTILYSLNSFDHSI